MSRTDKTDPTWLREIREGYIAHDHRDGRCVEETLEYTRWSGGSWRAHRRHLDRCPRTYWETQPPCGKTHGWRWVGDGFPPLEPVQCTGHRVRRRDETIHCDICVKIGEAPTCEYRISGHYVGLLGPLYGAGPTHSFRRSYEKTARMRERIELRVALRDYNGNGDTEIEPEPYRHRHCALWDWW